MGNSAGLGGTTPPDSRGLTWIANFIWGIADDVLRDLYVRGKYRDVILPMTVIRRLDAVLEPSKNNVLQMKESLDKAGVGNQEQALRQASGEAFYNTSNFTLKDLRNRTSQQKLRQDFEAYLDGFSPNVQVIIENFEFRNQLPRLSKADVLGTLIEKFLDPSLNLSPRPVHHADGSVRLAGLDNHGMGSIFEELVRRFNEENNEEAGEHWTPRDAIKLMANLLFRPLADEIESGTYLLYDGAIGTGGMLTVAEETLHSVARSRGKQIATHLYGQEINAETYAICKADLLLKGDGEEADNIVGGPEHSTLSNDAYPSREFDFMLSNPPYGKSWKTDLERMGGKGGLKDPRFITSHDGDPEFSLVTRSSDGQMMFLVNMLSKMKHDSKLGSRIAEVHNASSLSTGDAGQGESNIRRWILENDWLEAIVALPMNMFYNTGIATFIWVLSNRKPPERAGKVQLIDATRWFTPLRRNLGEKSCELSDSDIARICEQFDSFATSDVSRVFPNEEFGYKKITLERPLRLQIAIDSERRAALREGFADVNDSDFAEFVLQLADDLKTDFWDDYNAFSEELESAARKSNVKLTSKRLRLLQGIIGRKSPDAAPVIRRIHSKGAQSEPLFGRFSCVVDGVEAVVEYEPDPELRDSEQVPLLETGGVESFVRRQVLPFAPDSWVDPDNMKIGYEISFIKYFYKPEPLRPLNEIRDELLEIEKQTEGLVRALVTEGAD